MNNVSSLSSNVNHCQLLIKPKYNDDDIGLKNIIKTKKLIDVLERDKFKQLQETAKPMNYEILKKNKEILDIKQEQLRQFLKLVYDNVLAHCNDDVVK